MEKVTAVEIPEGAGARVRRCFPSLYKRHIDPFALFDEFFVDPSAGFPSHQHGGFEAITYMIEGRFRHEDTMGTKSEIGAGGVQYFTAGKGLTHSEMPGERERAHGFQLWVNLPRHLKTVDPSYGKVENVPQREFSGGYMNIIAGEGAKLNIHNDIRYYDIFLDTNASFKLDTSEDHAGFVYVYDGVLGIVDETLETADMMVLTKGETYSAIATRASRFLFITGSPHDQPIHIKGSFVE